VRRFRFGHLDEAERGVHVLDRHADLRAQTGQVEVEALAGDRAAGTGEHRDRG